MFGEQKQIHCNRVTISLIWSVKMPLTQFFSRNIYVIKTKEKRKKKQNENVKKIEHHDIVACKFRT